MKKVAVITGASSGIGLAIANKLLEKDYIVYALSRTKPANDKIKFFKCDVTDLENIKLAFEHIYNKTNQIDAVINNAGMGISGPIETEKLENINKIISVNLMGVFNVSTVAIPYLRQSKGRIINISSIAAEFSLPFQAYYSATKAGVLNFSSALGNELRPLGVKVTCLLPGDVKTDFTANRVKPESVNNEIYGKRFERALNVFEHDEENGMDPEKIANKIHKILKRKNPPATCTTGVQWKLLRFVKRIVPQRLVEWIIYRIYGK
ncbi:MAG: SDR family NAD(P)-dependent oxidoreductase [Clostridia bacterium]|nr:SDR family NAD(P)-dependent oxidoreductase [Clostridia bacterium]